MNTLNTTVEKSSVIHSSERRVTTQLLVRRINAALAKIGKALNLGSVIYQK